MEAHETLGDAILELGADWAPLRRELEAAGTYTRVKMDEMARSTAGFQRNLDSLGSALRNFTSGGAQFATVTTATKELTTSFLQLRSATEAYKLAAGSAAATTKDLAGRLSEARRQLGLTTAQVELLTKAIGLATTEIHEFTVEIGDMDEGLHDVNASLGEFIQLHGRIRALGPLLTPEQRRSITTDPAYQGLMRSQTESTGPGGPIVARVELPPEMGDRIVEAINTGRRLEALLQKQLETGEYSILGGSRGGRKATYARTERPELGPAPEMGPEFFDKLGQEMERVMAPVRAAWAQGINVTSAAAEASAQAAKETKDELSGIKSLLAQMGQEAAGESEGGGGEDIARLEALRRDITQYMAEPIANAVGDAVKRNLPQTMAGNKPGNAVAILGGAKSPETPVNANNPLPVGLVSAARSGLGANAANFENEPTPTVQSTAAGVQAAAPTSGTAAQPQQVVRTPTEQAAPAMTQEDLAARLLERESILARLPAGRVPRTGISPAAYQALAGRPPYYGPQRQLPSGETIGGEPTYVHRIYRGVMGPEVTMGGPSLPNALTGELSRVAQIWGERIGQLTTARTEPGGTYLLTTGHRAPQAQYPMRVPYRAPQAGETGTPQDVLRYIDSVLGQMASSEVRAQIAHELSQAGMPEITAGPGVQAPRRRIPRGGQWEAPVYGTSRYRFPPQPSREIVPFGPGVPMGREITPHTPETVMRNYGNLLHMFTAYEDVHTQDPGDPHAFAQAAAHLMAWLEALRAADEAMRGAGPTLPRGVPPAIGGGRQRAIPAGERQRQIPRAAIYGGTRAGPRQYSGAAQDFIDVEEINRIARESPMQPLSDAAIRQLTGGGGGDGGGRPPFLGMGGGEFFRRILWGGGGRIPLPFLGGIPGAGFGSLASLAGLGPEHLLGTGLAIGASGVAAGGGALTLAAGAAGTMAVGGGVDLAVLKSTLTDTQALSGSYTNLQNAVQTYGAKSRQAALAQGQLNQQLLTLSGDPKSGKPGVGALAELQLAKDAQSLDQFWDRSTQKARVQAVNIMQQGVTLGRDYTPRIAQAAQQNLAIINTGIKPLFSWLEGPQGVKIFNDLEGMFRKNLPTAVHAFSQAVEILLRFVDAASSHTGHFTETLDKFLTKINDRSSGYFTGVVDKLVGDFQVWEKFAKLLVEDLDLIFRQNAGAGKDIITTLDGMLGRLHTWLETSRGQSQLHSVFETHKQEVITLLDQLPKLLKAFGSFYLTISPELTKAFTGFIKLLADVLGPLVNMSPQITLFVGAMMGMQKMHVLIPTLKALAGLFTATAAGEEEMALAGGGGGAKGASALSSLFSTGTSTGGFFGGGAAKEEEAVAKTIEKEGWGAKLSKPFENLATNLEKRLSFLGDFAALASKGLIAGGAGFTGYLGGTAVQGATGLRKGGPASALGGLGGTAAGVAAAEGIGALAGVELGPIGMIMGASLGSAVGTAFGPTIGHFFSSIFGGSAPRNYGREFVREFNKALPGIKPMADVAIGPTQQEQMVKTIREAKNKAGAAWADFKSAQDTYRSDLAKPMVLGGIQVTPSTEKADLKAMNDSYGKYKALADTSGTDTAQYFIDAMQGVKIPTEFAFQKDILTALGTLKGPAQQSALDTLLGYVNTLEQNKELAPNEVTKILNAIKAQFPGLKTYMQQQGEQDDQALAEKMKLTQTQTQLQTTMHTIATEFGFAWVDPNISGKNWAKNVGDNAIALHNTIVNTTGQTRRTAQSTLKGLQDDTATHLDAMVQHAKDKMPIMAAQVKSGSEDAKKYAHDRFVALADSIRTSMNDGSVTTAAGMKLIREATETALKEFGAKLPKTGLDTSQNKLIQSFAAGRTSAASVLGHAQGGLVQVGSPGERGQDTIPMSVGGQPIMVGAGEQVAVFNAHQQSVMNNRLADYGGLGGFFNSVNTPHAKYQQGGYVFPFPKNVPFSWQRLDEGQDMMEAPGAPVLAIGPGNVTQGHDQFSGFGPFYPILQLSAGPLKGQSVYYGHAKTTRTGPVSAGEIIGVTQSRADEWTAAKAGWLEFGLGATLGQGNRGQGAQIAPLLHALASGARVEGLGIAGAGAVPTLAAPKVTGEGAVHDIVQGALNKATSAANQLIQAKSAAMGATGVLPSLTAGGIGRKIYNFFSNAGLSKIAIAGILGNWMQESTLNPDLTGASGLGLAQWIGGRRSSAEALAAKEGVPATSLALQLQYALSELHGSYSGTLAAINAAKTPEDAAQLFEHGFEGASAPMMQNRIAYARSAYAQGFQEGGFVPGFQAGGDPLASAAAAHPGTEVGPSHHKGITVRKPTGGSSTNTKKTVSHKPSRYPRPKGLKPVKIIPQMPASVATPLGIINADDTAITNLQNQLQIVQGREALWPVMAIITPIDPSNNLPMPPVVNWGNVTGMDPITAPPYTSIPAGPVLKFPPGGVGTKNWGMSDPSTGTWAYGLDVRLGEIGPHLSLGSRSTQDKTTELGLNNAILAKWWEEVKYAPTVKKAAQAEMSQLVQTIGWYDDGGNFHPGLWQQWVDRMKAQRSEIAPNKSDVAAKLKQRYDALRLKARQQARQKRLAGQLLRTITVDDLTKLQANMDAAIPGQAPYNWVAAGMGNKATGQANADYLWGTQERPREVAGVTDYITTLRDQANTDAMKRYYKIGYYLEDAIIALNTQEADARQELYDKATHKRITLDNLITSRQTLINTNKKILDSLSGQTAFSKNETVGGVIGNMNQIIDPTGQLQAVNIDTMRYITIPTLTNEISQILQTQPTQDTSGDQSALADAQNLMDLQSQRMVIQAEALASQASGFKIITDALKSMPPFAGHFQTGGIVPGPLGEARTIIAHGGETVTPPAQSQSQSQPLRMNIIMTDNTTRITIDDVEQVVQQSNNTAARHARRALPGRAGGLSPR